MRGQRQRVLGIEDWQQGHLLRLQAGLCALHSAAQWWSGSTSATGLIEAEQLHGKRHSQDDHIPRA